MGQTLVEWWDTVILHYPPKPRPVLVVSNTDNTTVPSVVVGPVIVPPSPPPVVPVVPIDVVPPILVIQGTGLAPMLARTMLKYSYNLTVGDTVTNIIYVEGMDTDGTKNAFRPNAFDCIRCLIRVHNDGSVDLLGVWEAITHAGMYWEMHRMNPKGAFHIALGQQACWTMGHYHNMQALVQTIDIIGTRDSNNNFKREGPTYKGMFGVHHHWGYNYAKDNAGNSSAGCQVGRMEKGHNEFIAILKTDGRYKKDRNFLWPSTVLTADLVLENA